jgi:hypothetical protein
MPTKAGKPTQQELKRRQLAQLIAKALFTDGTGERATRLVIELPTHKFLASGYCESAVADLIERKLSSVTIFRGGAR